MIATLNKQTNHNKSSAMINHLYHCTVHIYFWHVLTASFTLTGEKVREEDETRSESVIYEQIGNSRVRRWCANLSATTRITLSNSCQGNDVNDREIGHIKTTCIWGQDRCERSPVHCTSSVTNNLLINRKIFWSRKSLHLLHNITWGTAGVLNHICQCLQCQGHTSK